MAFCSICGSHDSNWHPQAGTDPKSDIEPYAADGLNQNGGGQPKPMSGVGPTERPVKAKGPPPLPRK